MDDDVPEEAVSLFQYLAGLVERLGDLAEKPAAWPENFAPLLLRWVIQIGGGVVVGGVVVALLFFAMTKFGVRLPGEFVKHDMFPWVMCAVMVAVPTLVAFKTAQGLTVRGLTVKGLWPSIGGLFTGITGAMGMHPRFVQIQQNRRKKGFSAKSTPESPEVHIA